MDVVLRTASGEAEISLGDTGAESTLADVVGHVTGQASPPIIFVDGRALPATTRVSTSGLLIGSTLSTSRGDTPSDDGLVELVQLAGRGSGASALLDAGRYLVGTGRRQHAPELDRAPVENPSFELSIDEHGVASVRALHDSIRLNARSIPSGETAEWPLGTLDTGVRVFNLNRQSDNVPTSEVRDRPASLPHSVLFNRRPRPIKTSDPHPVTSLSRTEIAEIHEEERDRQRQTLPNMSDVVQFACTTDPRLWERRRGDSDAFRLSFGLADTEWTPAILTSEPDRAEADRLVKECGPLPLVPIPLDLANTLGVGVIGQAGFTADLARGLLIQATVAHGPADLNIVVLTHPDRVQDWEWAKWLPHARTAATSNATPQVYFTEPEVRRWATSMQTEPPEQGNTRHLTIVIVDDPTLWSGRSSPLRTVFSEPPQNVRFIVLADSAKGTPSMCSTTITEDADLNVSVDFIAESRQVINIRPLCASVDVALSVALSLAPLDDPELPDRVDSPLPTSVSWLDLIGIDRLDNRTFPPRRSETGTHARTAIGVSAQGPVEIDLLNSGPHTLVAGQGAAELLQTLISGLASDYPPTDMNFVFCNFGNDATFDAVSLLPHTAWHEPGLDRQQATRLLRCLRSEVQQRRAHSDQDPETNEESSVPHLMVVVDDAEAAMAAVPQFLPELITLIRSGQEVGLHLVIAAEHPTVALDTQSLSAADLRFVLRMTEAESIGVIGTTAASVLPNNQPGRAYLLQRGAEKPLLFQAASVSNPDNTHQRIANSIRPFVIGRELSPMERQLTRSTTHKVSVSADTEPAAATEITKIVSSLTQFSAEIGENAATKLCPPSLPDHLPLRTFFNTHPGDGVPLGLVDLPDKQNQEPLWWRPDLDGDVLIAGDAGTGKTSLLLSLALGVGERFTADDVHLYCISAGGQQLDPLEQLPHTKAVARLEDPQQVSNLIRRLSQDLDQHTRRSDAKSGTRRSPISNPNIVLMIDDLLQLRDRLDPTLWSQELWPIVDRMFGVQSPPNVCTVITMNDSGEMLESFGPNNGSAIVLQPHSDSNNGRTGAGSATVVRAAGQASQTQRLADMQLVSPPENPEAAFTELATGLVQSPSTRTTPI